MMNIYTASCYIEHMRINITMHICSNIYICYTRVRALFHESNRRLYKTKIMTKNKTS